jgi:hypothetical protein
MFLREVSYRGGRCKRLPSLAAAAAAGARPAAQPARSSSRSPDDRLPSPCAPRPAHALFALPALSQALHIPSSLISCLSLRYSQKDACRGSIPRALLCLLGHRRCCFRLPADQATALCLARYSTRPTLVRARSSSLSTSRNVGPLSWSSCRSHNGGFLRTAARDGC